MRYINQLWQTLSQLNVIRILAQLSITLIPAISLAAFWFGLDVAISIATILGPLIFFSSKGVFEQRIDEKSRDYEYELKRISSQVRKTNLNSALIFFGIDDFEALRNRLTDDELHGISTEIYERLKNWVRDQDCLFALSPDCYAALLTPVKSLQTDKLISVIKRAQMALNDPCSLDEAQIYITLSAGYQPITGPVDTSQFIDDTKTALWHAQLNGPNAIRAYSARLKAPSINSYDDLEMAKALNNREFIPWFQPQVSIETGETIGVEALARWARPEQGILPPSVFLDRIEEDQKLPQLGDIIRQEAFRAMHNWHRAGFKIPTIGLNFSAQELSDPRLLQKIEWQLGQFDLSPQNLSVEILETVIADTPDDIICLNIHELAKLGCSIDLDDFGTGHASITSLRRFPVNRLKIDRSFVTHVHENPSQAKLIKAILSMSLELGLETLAEGVETQGEYHAIQKMGCQYAQGYGIAKPMSYDDCLRWFKRAHPINASGSKAG